MAAKEEMEDFPDEDMEAEYPSGGTGDLERDPFESFNTGQMSSLNEPDSFQCVTKQFPGDSVDGTNNGDDDFESHYEEIPCDGCSNQASQSTSSGLNHSKDDSIACTLVVYIREFIGQSAVAYVARWEISANSREEFLTKVWNLSSEFLHREILFEANDKGGSTPKWSFKDPTIEDFNRFALFQSGRRYYKVKNIQETNLLPNWQDKEISLFIHVYSMSVTNRTMWNTVKKVLFKAKGNADAVYPPESLTRLFKAKEGAHLNVIRHELEDSAMTAKVEIDDVPDDEVEDMEAEYSSGVTKQFPDDSADGTNNSDDDFESHNEEDPGECCSNQASQRTSSVLNHSNDDSFACTLLVYKREFIGQLSGAYVARWEISTNSREKFLTEVWKLSSEFLHREILFEANDPKWSSKESPTIEDFNRFALFQSGRRYYKVENIQETNVLPNWQDKEISLFLHVYSMSVSNRNIWKTVKEVLFEGKERDRDGAASTQAELEFTEELRNQLQKSHGAVLEAHSKAWTFWAEAIQNAPAFKRSSMMEYPPQSLAWLFKVKKKTRLNAIRYDLEKADNVNDSYQEDFVALHKTFDTPRASVKEHPSKKAKTMETDSASAEVSCNEEKYTITNQTIGPETGAIRCLFRAAQRHFGGQRLVVDELPEWLVRAHTFEEFRVYLWELARPYMKQAVMVETDENGRRSVCWTDPVLPTIEHANQYITFIEKKIKRTSSWESLTAPMIAKWDKMNIVVCIYTHTMAISSRFIYDLVLETLIAPRKPKPAGAASAKPVTAAASAKPRRQLLPESSDRYNFRDEVRALRETFLQMRDLMHVLDNRISLLEEKCDQSLQQEPLISMNVAAGEMVDIKPYGNPDPLIDRHMKQETLEDDDDGEAFDYQ